MIFSLKTILLNDILLEQKFLFSVWNSHIQIQFTLKIDIPPDTNTGSFHQFYMYLTTVWLVLKTVHVIIRISDQEILLTSVISLRQSCFFYNFRALEMVKGKFTKIFLSQLESEKWYANRLFASQNQPKIRKISRKKKLRMSAKRVLINLLHFV